MLNVCAVNAGNYLGMGAEYTNKLFDMVRRNLAEGYPGRFIVFTDCPDGYDEGIEVRPLPARGLSGWWNKLALFKEGTFAPGDRVLFFDLDTVIAGRIDDLAGYQGEFGILRDFYRPNGLQSSVMAWDVESCYGIWESWVDAGTPELEGGDQAWIERWALTHDILQNEFPDLFISYKVNNGRPPATASVVVFHGNPRPHEVVTGWVPEVWKIGGMSRAELTAVCNTENKVILDNITSNILVNVKWFDFDWSDDDQVCIVGGSPSLKTQLDELKWRKGMGHKIWALNGTHDYLLSQGIKPDAHFMLDARPENIEFVRNARPGVEYYVASQCDPAILRELLKQVDPTQITLFHNHTEGVADLLSDVEDLPVHLLSGGTTVGMKAMLIAELSGVRAIHLYGMDSCYTNTEHHAYSQPLNDGERILDVVYADRKFRCSPWMTGQANDFIDFATRYDGVITVAGDGLLAHIARTGLDESAAYMRAREILSRLPSGPVSGAEIGVFGADLSVKLLGRQSLNLTMVDSWITHGEGDYAESGDFHATLSQQQQDGYFEMATNRTKFADDRRKIIRASSVEAAKQIPDGSLDFVFIDADHSYKGCKEDIEAWLPKVKQGGLLCGHDYANTDFPCFGVDQAVDEFCSKTGLKAEFGDNFTWFVQLS